MLIRVKARNNVGGMDYSDLTGCTPKSQIRATVISATVVAEFVATITDQVTIKGGVLLTLAASVTEAMTLVTGVWDCEILYPNGEKKTVLAGPVTMQPGVTR